MIKAVEWNSEISARLRSLADDIRADGERRAALQRERSPQLSKHLHFCAVVFAHPAEVRVWTLSKVSVDNLASIPEPSGGPPR